MRRILPFVLVVSCTFFSTANDPYTGYLAAGIQTFNQLDVLQNTLDPRADSFDILHYHIQASFLDFTDQKEIEGRTTLSLVLLNNASKVHLDLLDLQVDSVYFNGSSTGFVYASPVLSISTSGAMKGDTLTLVVVYHGKPKTDQTWGGFYFNGEYAFNMGVGFTADPHPFGRVWFPCMDNFTDKSTYSFAIKVDKPFRAYCNGSMTKITFNGDGTQTFHWLLEQPIPSYLASVAISVYEEVHFPYNGMKVFVTAQVQDTANVRSSFEHLPSCIDGYQQAYGPHPFNRVGFNLVPFNAGAMEHATNIAYPIYAVEDGTKDNEQLFAHELAHHWWGDNTTCASQEDMWLNEGWAAYSEALFLEQVYGRESYLQKVRTRHLQVLQFAHTPSRDGLPLPVSGIGHEHTYGMHVYQKGADMVHTLRGIMGDEAFFAACAEFQVRFQFSEVTTEDMMHVFNEFTSFDLRPFFEQWIQTEGFCHFYIFSASQEGNSYGLRIKQDQRFNSITYKGIPYTVRAYAADMSYYDTTLILGGLDEMYNVILPFQPVAWVLDPEEWISDAITEGSVTLDSGETGVFELPDAFGSVDVLNIEQQSHIRLENHWVQPDHYYMNIPGLALHTQRYWTYDGVWSNSFEADLMLEYNGLGSYFLDNELIKKTEDSLVLLYRPNAWSYWQILTDVENDGGSRFDRRGVFTVRNAKAGQYALAMYDYQLLSGAGELTKIPFRINPNPASGFIFLEFENNDFGAHVVEITDYQGKVVLSDFYTGNDRKEKVDLSKLGSGVYYVVVVQDLKSYEPQRIVVK